LFAAAFGRNWESLDGKEAVEELDGIGFFTVATIFFGKVFLPLIVLCLLECEIELLRICLLGILIMKLF
jgi:hypothetical protein